MKRSTHISSIFLMFSLVCILLALVPTSLFSANTPAAALQHAWQRANTVGVFEYQTEIVQTAHPLPILENVGLSSTETRIAVVGKTNRPQKQMEMAMWNEEDVAQHTAQQNVSLHHVQMGLADWVAPETSVHIRIDHDDTYGRSGTGEWQTLAGQDATFFFAPGKDVLGYLAGATNVQQAGSDTLQGSSFTRYTFDMDGPAFAKHMQQQLQAELQRSGKLPAGLSVDVVNYYNDMEGTGEVWVNDQGLPIRQTLQVAFPHPYNQETVEASITTNFAGWQHDLRTAWITLPQLDSKDMQQTGFLLTLLALMMGIMAMMVRHWRSRRLYMVVSLSILFTMLTSPLLQGLQTQAFAQELQTQQQTQIEQQQTNQVMREVESSMLRPSMDPHSNPLEVGAQTAAPPILNGYTISPRQWFPQAATNTPNAVDTDNDGLSDQDERDTYGTNPYKADTDGDKLSDSQEILRIGTSALNMDTDNDGISDGIEIHGFIYKGKQWYLNAFEADTNKDSLGDGLECPALFDVGLDASGQYNVLKRDVRNAVCDDTDNDGTPDVWDYDDDNDGVSDKMDDSPLTVLSGFENQTLAFQLDDVTPGKSTFVDFQIRPTTGQHLWYDRNVLDWISNDRAGQIQRVTNSTFRDLNGDSTPSMPKDSNGDIRLTPMLEIEIPYQQGSAGGLPTKCDAAAGACPQREDDLNTWLDSWLDKEEMQKYGISVRAKDNEGTLVAYVPLHTIKDDVTQSPTAFAARMYYRPNSTNFGKAQKIRLAWFVQMITDQCTTPPTTFAKGEDEATRYDQWCEDTSHWESSVSLVHTYYDDWKLTGLTIREDHGGTMGAITQPSSNDVSYQSHLWNLAQGLENSFVAGRNDMSVQEIQRRFDSTRNGQTSDKERWGIPHDTFRVQVESFKDETDMAKFPTQYNQTILNESFGGASLGTILFVQNETYRTATLGMDQSIIQTGGATSSLKVSLSPNQVPLETRAMMKWSTFQTNGEVWEAVDEDTYEQQLATTLTALLQDTPASDVRSGKVVYLKGFSVAMNVGVQQSNNIDSKSDAALYDTLRGQEAVRVILDACKPQYGLEKNSFFRYLGMMVQGFVPPQAGGMVLQTNNTANVSDPSSGIDFIIDSALDIYQRSMQNPSIKTNVSLSSEGLNWMKIGAKGAIGGYGLYSGIKDVKNIAKLKKAKEISKAKSATRACQKMAVVGFVVSVGVSAGTFLYLWESGAIEPGTPAFKQALATMVAEIVVAAILLAIELLAGPVVVAVIALFDFLLGAICKAAGGDTSDNEEVKFLCNGIVGMLTKALAKAFYDYTPVIDMNRGDRIDIGSIETDLAYPEKGFVVGGGFITSIAVKSKIVPYSKSSSIIESLTLGIVSSGLSLAFKSGSFTEADFRDSTFQYELTTKKEEGDERIHKRLNLKSGTMSELWQKITSLMYEHTSLARITFPFTHAGINWSPSDNLYLAEGSVIKGEECVMLVSCKFIDESSSQYFNLGPVSSVFDVFPATIDEFYTFKARKSNDGRTGYALAWDASFPVLADADGDGLRSTFVGGNDPNDAKPDSDGDGFSDFYEMQHTAQGFNPLLDDTDQDTLSTYQEVLYGTNPSRRDSDYDGLPDNIEVQGWEYVYDYAADGSPLTIIVTSNPLNPDTDNDTLLDSREWVFGSNPRLWDDPQFLTISSQIQNENSFVAPGKSINYVATIENVRPNRHARGLLEVDFPVSVDDANIHPKTFLIGPREQIELSGSVTVRSDIAQSQIMSITNRANAFVPNALSESNRIANPETIDYMMRFDEPPGMETFSIGTNRYTDKSFSCQQSRSDLCPQSGVPGIFNQAIRLSRYDTLSFSTGQRFQVSPTTISFWMNPDTLESEKDGMITFFTYQNTKRFGIAYDPTSQKVLLLVMEAGQQNQWYFSDAVIPTHTWSQVIFVTQPTPYFLVRTPSNHAGIRTDIPEVSSTFFTDPFDLSIGQDFLTEYDTFQGLLDHLAIREQLPTSQQLGEAHEPEIMLHLDELVGETSFDNANTTSVIKSLSCTGNACPTAGSLGQVRNGLQFDGQDDTLVLPLTTQEAQDALNNNLAVGLWVKPERQSSKVQTLVSLFSSRKNGRTFSLWLDKDLTLRWSNEHVTFRWEQSLLPDVWNHVVVVDKSYGETSIYLNGEKLPEPETVVSNYTNSVPAQTLAAKYLTIGSHGYDTVQYEHFAGMIDEVSIWATDVPNESEIRGMAFYQNAWVQAATQHNVVIDADKPDVRLDYRGTHIANREIVLPVVASDETSGLVSVEYSADNGSTWQEATLDEGVWTFSYTPPAEGPQEIRVRAVDLVGNSSEQVSTLIVDGSPPVVQLDDAGSSIPLPLTPIENQDTFTVHLTGSTTDAGEYDIGVERTTISLFNAQGGLVGQPRMLHDFDTDGRWAIDYPVTIPVNEVCRVQIEGVDELGNTVREDFSIVLENLAPTADIALAPTTQDDEGNFVQHVLAGVGDNLPVIQGTMSDVPVTLNPLFMMHFEEPSGATTLRDSSGNFMHGSCSGDACPQAIPDADATTALYGTARSFDGIDDMVTISDGETYAKTVKLYQNHPAAYMQAATLPPQEMTIAAWVAPNAQPQLDGFISAMQAIDGAEKGWMLGSRGGRFTFGLSSADADDGDGFMTFLEVPETYEAGQWYHLAATYDGTTMKIYVNGELQETTDVQSGPILYPESAWFGIGAYQDGDEFHHFNGKLDEIFIHNQALRSDEIALMGSKTFSGSGVSKVEIALQHAQERAADAALVWQEVSFTTPEPQQPYAAWSYQVPADMEGPYHIALRVTDQAGNVRVIPSLWNGTIDTQAPRLTLKQTEASGQTRYTTRAEDFNMSENHFNSPCGIELITSREQNDEAWYLDVFSRHDADGNLIPAPDRLYRLGAECGFSDANAIAEMAVLPSSGGLLQQVSIVGTTALVQTNFGFKLFDVSTPSSPRHIRSYNTPDRGFTEAIAVQGNYAYVTYALGGLDVIDISNPKNPRRVGTSDTRTTMNSLWVSGNYAYVTDTRNRLQSINISDPASPKRVSRYQLPASADIIAMVGTQLYVLDVSSVSVINVSDPTNMVQTTFYRRPRHITQLVIDSTGTYAYGIANNALSIYDRANSFKQVGSYTGLQSATDVSVVGTYAYVAEFPSGIRLVDVSNPAQPKLNQVYHTPARVSRMAINNQTLYASTNSSVRLYNIETRDSAKATACDKFGNCTTMLPTNLAASLQQTARRDEEAQNASAPSQLSAELPAIDIIVSPVAAVYPTNEPIAFTAALYAEQGLKEVTMSIDGTTLLTQQWTQSDAIIETLVTTPEWTPSRDGQHTLVIQAIDYNGATVTHNETTVVVDTHYPAALVDHTILNNEYYQSETGTFALSGILSDSATLADVQIELETAQGIEPLPTTITDADGNEAILPAIFAADSASGYGTLHWNATWSSGGIVPDGVDATLTVRVTDMAGHQTTFQESLLFDGILPQMGDVTLGYTTAEGTTTITPGMTLSAVENPELVLMWQAASDLGNISHYLAGWSTSPELRQEELTRYAPDIARHTQPSGDVQHRYAHLVAVDSAGNQSEIMLGPIYVDYGPTPSYIAMDENGSGTPYRSWNESACSLVGVDNRIRERALATGRLNESQKLYTTWDAQTLRMMWTGANWDYDGDLFIYLDTQDGGSTKLFDPYPATITNTAILLPPSNTVSDGALQATDTPDRPRLSATNGQMAADAIIWVAGSITATLLLWDGTTWQPSSEGLDYVFEKNLPVATTDLAVSFDALGIDNPAETTLGMLAVATEQDALRLWATMPPRNNLNSERIVDLTGESQLQMFALTKQYAWTLGDGVCPSTSLSQTNAATVQANGTDTQATGADVQISISSYPPGAAYSLHRDNLFFAMKDLPPFAGIDWSASLDELCAANADDAACQRTPAAKPALLTGDGKGQPMRLESLVPTDGGAYFSAQSDLNEVLDSDNPPLGDSNLVVYTMELVNQGSVTSRDIVADIYTWGSIRLPGGEHRTDSAGEYDVRTLDIGDLEPSERIRVPFPAMVDATFDPQNQHGKVTIDVTIYDSTGEHQHRIDGTDVYTNELEWLFVEHEVDTSPPDYIEILSPNGILAPGRNSISGFVYDRSAVPVIEMEIQHPDGTTSMATYHDDTPDDKAWECLIDTGSVHTGDSFAIRVRATDFYGATGAWSPWSTYVIDATPPSVSLSDQSQSALADGAIGENEALLSGTISDNDAVNKVEICSTTSEGEACEQATVVTEGDTQSQTTFFYEDTPTSPLALGQQTSCDSPLVRTFVVTESFDVSRVQVGLNIAHTLRGDLNVALQSPAGTKVMLLYDGTAAHNYDVLIDDASPMLDRDDNSNHDIGPDYYENQRGGYGLLSTFAGEPAAGEWKLTMCDSYPASDHGFYHQSQLMLEAPTQPVSTTATWEYVLPTADRSETLYYGTDTSTGRVPYSGMFMLFLPMVQSEYVAPEKLPTATPSPSEREQQSTTNTDEPREQTIQIYGIDAQGNRTSDPLQYTYYGDTVAPTIQLTSATAITLTVSDVMTGGAGLQVSGVVSDALGIQAMRLVLIGPDALVYTAPITPTGWTWQYAHTQFLSSIGNYLWWIEADDTAGNTQRVGPYTLTVQDTETVNPLLTTYK